MTKILCVAAHPDDVEIGCGGYIIKNIALGNEVSVLLLTSGEHGCPDLTTTEATAVREVEATVASNILGSTIEDFWRLPDGQLTYSNELRDRLVREIERISPDVILVTHERESHPDHRAAGRLVREALNSCSNKSIECFTTEIWTAHTRTQRVLNISDVIDKKLEAIRAHHSQVERIKFDDAALALNRFRGVMYGNCEYAEVFGKMRQNGADGMKICLALLTYAPSVDHPRAEYARITLNSALALINPGQNNDLHVHIADDGSDPEHIQKLIEISRQYGYEPSITNAQRGGYGKSYNLMMQAVHSSCDLVLPLEDDWELTKELNLEHLAKVLEESNGEIKSIRLGYLGITQPLKGTVMFRSGMTYLLLDPDSPEPHVFCGHPRLETVAYQKDVGAWPEGIRAGDTEWEVTHRWPARTGVAWPLDIGIPASQDWGALFAHIGSQSNNQLIPEGAKV